MKENFLKIKKLILEKAESLRLKIATHPKVVVWRLQLFGVHPFLGSNIFKILGSIFVAFLIYGCFYFTFWKAPSSFPEQALVTVEKGSSLTQIANSFEQKGVIKSSFWLKFFIVLWGGEKRVIAGDYYFPNAVSVIKVANMVHKGEFGLIAKRITIPEGISSIDISRIVKKELPNFDDVAFIDEVLKNNYEGYLFPDTYFLMPNTKPSDLITMMRENFARQTKQYEADVLKFQKPIDQVITMASIIEDEANKSIEAKRIVSGILWKRLKMGMPLQVDSAFVYYNGKNSYTLTKQDLAEDHEYNTYTNKGLPPTAISNPGIDSFRAAITPTPTQYLYFLSDKAGNMYYARTFEEHKANKELHLR